MMFPTTFDSLEWAKMVHAHVAEWGIVTLDSMW